GGACADSSRGAMGIAQPLEEIIKFAYQESGSRMIINAELPQGKYDFIAKLVGPQPGNRNMPTDEHWAEALQNEIKKQFGIVGRLEMRDTDVLLLRPVETSARGFTVSHSMPHGRAIMEKPGNFSFFEQPVGTLVGVLQRYSKLPVVEKARLTETYDYTV